MGIEHVGLFVADLDKAVEFYQRFFHAEKSVKYHNEKTTFSSYFLSFPDGTRLELGTRADLNHQRISGYPLGYMHLAFALGSKQAVDDLTAQIVAAGYEHLSGPRMTGDG